MDKKTKDIWLIIGVFGLPIAIILLNKTLYGKGAETAFASGLFSGLAIAWVWGKYCKSVGIK